MAKKYPQVKYEIDLVRVFNRAVSDKPQKLRSKLRALINDRLFKRKFAENVIDRIAHRTEKQRVDKKNKPLLAPYSKAYQKSLEFKVHGKSSNKVNLKLTGEMLASMKMGRAGELKLKIIMADPFNNSKAHGHINGIKRKINQDAKVKVKKGKAIRSATKKVKRDFLGLPADDEADMMRLTIKEFNTDSIINEIDFEKETLDFALSTADGAPVGITAASEVDTE